MKNLYQKLLVKPNKLFKVFSVRIGSVMIPFKKLEIFIHKQKLELNFKSKLNKQKI